MSDLKTKDMYTVDEYGTAHCGKSIVRKCARRKEGEEQYSIQYNGSSLTSGSVKKGDIPAVVAALLDFMEE